MNVKFKYFLFNFFLPASGMLILVFLNVSFEYSRIKRERVDHNDYFANLIASEIDSIYAAKEENLISLTKSYSFFSTVKAIDSKIQSGDLSRYLESSLDPDVVQLKSILETFGISNNISLTYVAFEKNDSILTSGPGKIITKDFSPKSRPWYKGATQNKNVFISKFYRSAADGGLVSTMSISVFEGERLIAVLGMDFQISSVLKTLEYFKSDKFDFLFVFDPSDWDTSNLINTSSRINNDSLSEILFKLFNYFSSVDNKNFEEGDFEVYLSEFPKSTNLVSFKKIASKNLVVGVFLNYEFSLQKLAAFLSYDLLFSALLISFLGVLSSLTYLSVSRSVSVINQSLIEIIDKNKKIGPVNLLTKDNSEINALSNTIDVILGSFSSLYGDFKLMPDRLNNQKERVADVASSLNSFSMNVNNKRFRTKDLEKDFDKYYSNLKKNISSNDFHLGGFFELFEAYRFKMNSITSFFETVFAKTKNLDSLLIESIDILDKLQNQSSDEFEIVNKVVDKMDEIEAKSKELEEANVIIAGIASRTNILAMNAAIEAVHSGGRQHSFTIVADEIRKLAEKSASQSKRIEEKINDINSSISQSIEMAYEAKTLFNLTIILIKNIGIHIQNIKSLIKEILQEINSSNSFLSDLKFIDKDANEKLTSFRNASYDFEIISSSLTNTLSSLIRVYGETDYEISQLDVYANEIKRVENEIDKNSVFIKGKLDIFKN